MRRRVGLLLAFMLALTTGAVAHAQAITSETLLSFLPAEMGGAHATRRQVIDDHLVFAAYRTPTGFINVNLAITRSVSFDRAQVDEAGSDEVHHNAVSDHRGVAVGRFRGVLITRHSGNSTELRLFLGDRINVELVVEGRVSREDMVALANTLDLNGLAAIAARIPAPREP